MRTRIYWYAAVCAAVGLIFMMTLAPIPGQAARSAASPWYCLVCGDQGMVDVALNVALFLPLGYLIYRAGGRPSVALLVGGALSLMIEIAQFSIISGRDASLSDLVTNTLGSGLGAILAQHWALLWRPPAALARRLAIGSGTLWLLMLGVTGWLLLPAPLPPTLYLWTPPESTAEAGASGQLDTILTNSLPVTGTDLGTRHATYRLAPREVGLAASIATVGITDDVQTIVDLADPSEVLYSRVAQLGQKGLFSVRLNATRVRLRTPDARVYRALAQDRTVLATFGGELRRGILRASVTTDGRIQSVARRMSPGFGWVLIVPLDYPLDHHDDLMAALWVAPLLLLAGYYSGRARLGWRSVALTTVPLVAVGLGAIPLAAGLPGDTGLAWASAFVAVAAGWLMGTWRVGHHA